jgi:hypothetical protein
MIVDGYRQISFGIFLSHHIEIKKGLDLRGFHQLEFFYVEVVADLRFLVDDLPGLLHAVVTDVR